MEPQLDPNVSSLVSKPKKFSVEAQQFVGPHLDPNCKVINGLQNPPLDACRSTCTH